MSEIINSEIIVNDLKIDAIFHQEDINNIFIPILKKVSLLQQQVNKRIFIYITAGPGVGKSTLVSFLENLSNTHAGITSIQGLGIDGFHFSNNYLKNHHINDNLQLPVLYEIKGAYNTFNTKKLESYIKKATTENIVWPIYSRVTHDISDEGTLVNKDIIFLEGNYLLLKCDDGWNKLSKYATLTIDIKADVDEVKRNLINRKIAGGLNRADAKKYVEKVDLENFKLIETQSKEADIILHVNKNSKFTVLKGNL